MLRRFFSGSEAVADAPDHLLLVDKLFDQPGFRERSLFALRQAISALPGDVRGYVVRRKEGDRVTVEALEGYGSQLLSLELENGPWRDLRPRLIPNLVAELFTPNSQELRATLGDLGLRDAKSSLIVPVEGAEHAYGAMLLDRHSAEPFTDDDVKLARRWGSVLGDAQALHLDLWRTRQSLVEFTRAFVEAVEAQDFNQLGHAGRVTAYALAIGRTLGFTREQLADLYFAAMLHDVGKLGSGQDLSIEDNAHPQRGANLVASSPLLADATEGIRTHHEHWDGTGFPLHLRKKDIPLLGRIVAVADTFDLLSSERGQALPIHEVEKGLELRAGRELDPELVQLFINILRQGKSTAELGKLENQDLPF